MSNPSTALVIGASRGLGLALAEEYLQRGWRVFATERTPSAGLAALSAHYPASLEIASADIRDGASVAALRERFDGQVVDVLFVNAGICLANQDTAATAHDADFVDMMLTNALGPVRAIELLEGLVPAKGVIAVMSSGLGSITNNEGFWPLYSASKAALNMLMKGFAGARSGDPRAMLLIAPGWVRTDMGGSSAPLSIEQSVPLVVDTVDRNRGHAGLRYVDRHNQGLPW